MGCRILVGTEGPRDREQAVLFDSVSGWAFGPLFDETGHADAFGAANCFQTWLVEDARAYPIGELERKYNDWLEASGRMASDEGDCRLCNGSGDRRDDVEAAVQ